MNTNNQSEANAIIAQLKARLLRLEEKTQTLERWNLVVTPESRLVIHGGTLGGMVIDARGNTL